MPITLGAEFIERMRTLLYDIWEADEYDYAYDSEFYGPNREELIGALSQNVSIATAFLDSLDFDNEVDQHIITCIPDIASRLGRFGAQFLFIEHVKDLQQRFPAVHFATAIHWAQFHCGFLDGTGKPRSAK